MSLPLPLEIRAASVFRCGFVFFVHALVLLGVLLADWRQFWPVALLIPLSLCWQWRKQESVQLLQPLPDGAVQVTWRDGRAETAAIGPASRVTSVIVVLHLRFAARTRVIVLWPDSAPDAVLRAWRIWLRWQWPQLVRRSETGKV